MQFVPIIKINQDGTPNVAQPYKLPENKAHYNPLQDFMNQDIMVQCCNSAFSRTGILKYYDKRMLVLYGNIGTNKDVQPVMDNFILMISEVASISRNPKNMESK